MEHTSHLDIGCNSKPRNPYNADKLYGVDIIDLDTKDFNYQKCNLIFDSLPFPDSSFDSVSAYDFLEHVPRTTTINNIGVFPFIHVMNEIYRVLKPGGMFHGITPGVLEVRLLLIQPMLTLLPKKLILTLLVLNIKLVCMDSKENLKLLERLNG